MERSSTPMWHSKAGAVSGTPSRYVVDVHTPRPRGYSRGGGMLLPPEPSSESSSPLKVMTYLAWRRYSLCEAAGVGQPTDLLDRVLFRAFIPLRLRGPKVQWPGFFRKGLQRASHDRTLLSLKAYPYIPSGLNCCGTRGRRGSVRYSIKIAFVQPRRLAWREEHTRVG
jgi:hypothetical protein